MNAFNKKLLQRLHQQKESNLYRKRKNIHSPQDVRVNLDGKEYLNFSSNDYLGLANHPRLKKRFKQAIDKYGCGSGASHLMSGHTQAHQKFEEELAGFLSVDAVLLYSSGYMANLGIFNAILDKKDQLFFDKLNHASLIDAGLSANASMKRYPHLNYLNLEKNLADSTAQSKMIVTDAVFSMDGDVADLLKIQKIRTKYQAELMIDDAHGFGVLGNEGKGLPELMGIAHNDISLYMATCGKAMGVSGAFIAANKDIIDSLIQFSRTYTYTTAMPAAQAETLRESLLLIQEESWRRDKLNDLIHYFKQIAGEYEFDLMPSNTAIQPIMIGSSDKAEILAKGLLEKGILVTAVRPPTVPKNTARLRITLSANHSKDDIEQFFERLVKSVEEVRNIMA